MNIVQSVFALLLKQFNLTFEELEKYLNNSVSSVISTKVNLYAFEACSCEKNKCKNFIAKKVAISQETYTINFDVFNSAEITKSGDYDRRILTHIFISFIRVYENKWSGQNCLVSYKLHKMANNLIEYFVCGRKWVYVISSEEEQKENSFEKIKNIQKIESAKKANIPKVVQLNRDYGNICKCAIVLYVKEKNV